MKTKKIIIGIIALFLILSCNNTNLPRDNGTTYGNLSLVYVDATNSSGIEDGVSWDTAFTSLQDALSSVAENGEIRVAAGTYYPTSGTDRSASFKLLPNVSLYGGFSGSETLLSERDYLSNTTILSGDIDKNSILDTGNSYHVVTGSDYALLDGFTITMGYAVLDGVPPSDYDSVTEILDVETGHENDEILRIIRGVTYIAGAGLFNLKAGTTVQNCVFEDNYATKGGAVYNMTARSYPTDTGTYETPTFINVIFQNNTATARGGAINNDMYTPSNVISCQFLDNVCDDKGGALYTDMGCNVNLVNVLFAGNTAERAASLVSDGSSHPILKYVTIVDNTATDIGAALYQGSYGADGQTAGAVSSSNDPRIDDCLVLGNTSGASGTSISSWHDCDLIVDTDSIIEETDGSLTVTDYFTDQPAGDYSPKPAYATLGWDPDRDVSNWETLINTTGLSERTYATFPYDLLSSPGTTTTYYVDASAIGSNNGLTWADAFTDLQTALSLAGGGDTIRVAAGTYYPTSGTDREAAFVVKRGINLQGGYPPTGGVQNISTNVTILSGDIDKNATLDSNNSYHVVLAGTNATVNGFTITGGYADGDWFHQRGAGLLCYDGESPTISNSIITDNYAIEGAGMANYNMSSPVISNCEFSNNDALRGGALLCRTGSDAQVTATTFSSNSASDRGGAVYNDYGANASFSANCLFDSNTSSGSGGAVYIDDNASQSGSTEPTFTDCDFQSNETTADYGGAIFAYNSSTVLTVDTCTFTSNTAAIGGYAIGMRFKVEATLTGNSYNEGANALYSDSTCVVH